MIRGEGETKTILKTRVRRGCDYCSEPAFYKNTYLDEGSSGARNNPASSAYKRDDCMWSSDFDDYLCPDCHQVNNTENVPEGYQWCATFPCDNFPDFFLRWDEVEISSETPVQP